MLSAHPSRNGAADVRHNGGNPRPTLIFLHIPKAAGSTFNSILEPRFDPKRTFSFRDPLDDIERLKALPEAERARLQLIKGHLPYGIHEHLRQPFEYITMLRDPVERMISHYYYVLRSPDHYLHHRVTSEKMSLKQYVLGKLTEGLDNGQVRLISGCARRLPYGGCSREWLERAKHNLEHGFSVVGLAERFDESLLLVARKFAWKDTCYVPHNVTERRPRREEFPADVIEAIEKVSQLDMELYTFAQELFRASVRRLSGPLFKLKVARFKARNSRHQKQALARAAARSALS